MPYATASMKTAQVMIKSFATLNEEITGLSKDKKNKDKVKTLAKELKEKGGKIDKVLVQLIADTRKEFTRHALKVEGLLTDAVQKAKAVAELRMAYEKDGSGEGYSDAMKLRDEIAKMAEEAKEDADDFGSSWFELRGTNFTSDGLTEEYNSNFYKTRFALMGDAKAVVGKIDQIRNLHKMAALDVNEMSGAFASEGEQDVSVIEEDCKDLLEKIRERHSALNFDNKTNPERTQSSVDGVREAFASQPGTELVTNVKTRVQDLVAMNKAILGDQKVFTKAIATQRKLIKTDAPKAEEMLQECDRLTADFTRMAKGVAEGAKAYAALMNEMVAFLEKGKKKK